MYIVVDFGTETISLVRQLANYNFHSCCQPHSHICLKQEKKWPLKCHTGTAFIGCKPLTFLRL